MHNPPMTFMEQHGYTVQPITDSAHPAYRVSGPKGAAYTLCRNVNTPEIMFACNAKTMRVERLGGYGWFTDRNGTIEPVQPVR